MRDVAGPHIHIDLRNIEGNGSCIKKIKLFKDGRESGPIFSTEMRPDLRITLPGDDQTLFCENTQMKILLTDSEDNHIGEMKRVSILKLSNEFQKIVLKPINNDILNVCNIKNFLLTIYCKDSLAEKTTLTLRRSVRLYENLMDLDVGKDMSGKYCSLLDSNENHHWIFIGAASPETVESDSSC